MTEQAFDSAVRILVIALSGTCVAGFAVLMIIFLAAIYKLYRGH